MEPKMPLEDAIKILMSERDLCLNSETGDVDCCRGFVDAVDTVLLFISDVLKMIQNFKEGDK